jgi:hypothetical protein
MKKKGAAKIVPRGGVDFEFLLEIINPIPAGTLESQGL